jgi:hypothetical protein
MFVANAIVIVYCRRWSRLEEKIEYDNNASRWNELFHTSGLTQSVEGMTRVGSLTGAVASGDRARNMGMEDLGDENPIQ